MKKATVFCRFHKVVKILFSKEKSTHRPITGSARFL